MSDPVTAFLSGVAAATLRAVGLLRDLGLLDRVKSRLLSSPDAAAPKLSAALSEIGRSYQALDQALVGIAAMSFADGEDAVAARRFLLEAQGGRVQADLASARGHCHVIWNLYERHLRGWFTRRLKPGDAEGLDRLFQELRDIDNTFVMAMEEIARGVPGLATAILDRLDAEDFRGAELIVARSRRELGTPRRRLAEAMTSLWQLQAKFVATTGTTG